MAVAAKEYVKVECYVSVLKEAKDRDFGTRYVISRSQIHILFWAARSRKNFEVTARHLQKCKPPFPLALAKEKSVSRFVKLSEVPSFHPVLRISCSVGLVHLVERLTAEREVAGSIPGTRPILRVLKITEKLRYCLCPANG